MKKSEVLDKVLAGSTVIVGVCHTCKLEPLNFRDKSTGNAKVAHIEKTTVITETGVGIVENWLKDGLTPEAWQPPVKKGEKMAVIVTKQDNRGGVLHYSGEIAKLTD